MTYFLLSVLLFLVAPVCAILWLKTPQYFNFVNLFFLLQCVLLIPAAVFLVGGSASLHMSAEASLTGPLTNSVSTFFMQYALMNTCVLIGLLIAAPPAREIRLMHSSLQSPRSPRPYLLFSWILVFLGLLMFVWKVNQIGGFSFLFANTSQRVELQSGFGPINILQEGAFWVAILFSAKLVAAKRVKRSWVLSFVLVLGIACLTSTIFGGRKSAIHYIFGSLMIISFYRPNFFNMTPRNTLRLLALVGTLLLYFFSVQAYRDTSNLSKFTEEIPTLLEKSIESASDVAMSLSYLDTYVFATEHYDSRNRHGGKTFLDLGTAFLPSAMVANKPPVDEGLYIRAATLGYRVEVGSPASRYEHNSWPSETYGTAMMNFGPISLPIFGLILGAILGLTLRHLISSRGSDFALLLAVAVFLNFEISNLRIVNLTVFAISVWLFLMAFRTFFLRRRTPKWRPAT